MSELTNIWVIVLAGGEGSRLHSMARDAKGACVPKQFWAPAGGPSMLATTIERARRHAPDERIVVCLTEQHRRWWEPALAAFPRVTAVVQPENRGTATGILFPLMEVLRRDTKATVVVLPSDHHVENEEVFREAIETAAAAAAAQRERIVILGIEPEEPSTDYGWILPSRLRDGETTRVGGFVEKPCLPLARSLLARGALWNSFVMAGTVHAFLRAFERMIPDLPKAFLEAVRAVEWFDRKPGWAFETLPIHDFSRDVLEHTVDMLSVLPVPHCGWMDLGTPDRVKRFLTRSAC